jgi:hypothetical protein
MIPRAIASGSASVAAIAPKSGTIVRRKFGYIRSHISVERRRRCRGFCGILIQVGHADWYGALWMPEAAR